MTISTHQDGIYLFRADDNLEYNGLDFEGKTENSEFQGGKGERYRCGKLWQNISKLLATESSHNYLNFTNPCVQHSGVRERDHLERPGAAEGDSETKERWHLIILLVLLVILISGDCVQVQPKRRSWSNKCQQTKDSYGGTSSLYERHD